MEALQDYLSEKIGWNREKFKSIVVPVIERFKNKECQTRIDSYFSVKFPSKTATVVSKRVMDALKKADFGDDPESEPEENIAALHQNKRQRIQKSRTGKTTKAALEPSTSTNFEQPGQTIWQRENDKKKLAENKLKAIELFKKSKGRGKQLVKRPPSSRPNLSESDSSSS